MKTRLDLIAQLTRHQPFDPREAAMLARVLAFVEQHENCFERSLLVGHVTGSAWVLDPDHAHTLLVHHARLDKWLQPGGHCDGDADVLGTAIREAQEETGLLGTPAGGAIFDVDAHDIPARRDEPAHVHYDIRYLLLADRAAAPVVSPESRAVAWVPLDEVCRLNTDESVLRLVAKTRALKT